MAKTVIGADRNHVVVADLDDLNALTKRIAALEAMMAQSSEPAPDQGPKAAED